MFKINVYVGRLIPFFADKPLHQQINASRVYRRDAKTVADGGIGRGATTLTQNPPRAGKQNNVVHRQKIGGIVQYTDKREFVFDSPPDHFGNPLRVTLSGTLPGPVHQMLHHVFAGRANFGRVLVFELTQ